MDTRAKGIDISHYQTVEDWAAIRRSGVSFVGMKATEGNSILDKKLRRHRDAFRQHDFLLGIYYHFARSGKPRDQAQRLMDAVGPLKPNERFCLDYEVSVTLDPKDGLEWIDDFMNEIVSAYHDRPPIIYTSSRWWIQLGDEEKGGPHWDRADEVDLWIPRYNSQGLEPKLPRPWSSAGPKNGNGIGWTFWQWTDGGGPHGNGPDHVTPGIKGGHCDANYFRSGEHALAEYAKLANVVVPGPTPDPDPPIVVDVDPDPEPPPPPAVEPPAPAAPSGFWAWLAKTFPRLFGPK